MIFVVAFAAPIIVFLAIILACFLPWFPGERDDS